MMFGKRISLFKLLGFEVHMDLSWLIIALLVSWSLAEGVFPFAYEDLSTASYWWMGISGAIGLFLSIVFHELCHSLVARRFGLPMKGITLFVFGGVAEMTDEPPSPKAEFLMAAAGPLSSIILGVLFYILVVVDAGRALPSQIAGVVQYLAFINLVLAGFNLVPAFPLDGGRILRSALWQWKKNLRWATRIASGIGSAFGILLIAFGIFNVIMGRIVSGIWQFMIGMFLRNAAQMSYRQVLIRRALEGETVGHFMKTDPITSPSSISLQELVDKYIYAHHFKMFPVVDNGKLVGCVSMRQVKKVPQDQWQGLMVADVVNRCSADNTITREADALKALALMSRTGNGRLMVVDEERLVGIITLKDIMGFISAKMDLSDYNNIRNSDAS